MTFLISQNNPTIIRIPREKNSFLVGHPIYHMIVNFKFPLILVIYVTLSKMI